MASNRWELHEALIALNADNAPLARRYIHKALARVQCVCCHGALDRPHSPHFKGFVHDDCAKRYAGRVDYLTQHPEDDDGF